jgi:isoquinoline 1-oxidoreductase beta subunit
MESLSNSVSRRDAIKVGLIAGTGFVYACKSVGGGSSALSEPATTGPLIHFIQITTDNRVRYLMPWSESGQGIDTGLAALIGEELNLDIREIEIDYGNASIPEDKSYRHQPSFTGASQTIRTSFDSLRLAAAAYGEMLRSAAATKLNVPFDECILEKKHVIHKKSGASATFGSLATAALALPIPDAPRLKMPPYQFIGKSIKRLNCTNKVNGTAVYGIDGEVPGMLNATMIHSPFVGGKFESMDDSAVRSMPGIIAVVPTPFGVGVVADKIWQAMDAAAKLASKIKWSNPQPQLSSASLVERNKERLQNGRSLVAESKGNFANSFSRASKKIEGTYQAPYLPHLTLEPQNCIADVRANGTCEIWAPSQDPYRGSKLASEITGFAETQIKVNVTLARV